MELDQLPDKVTGKVSHAVEGIRERAAGAVAPDAGSVFREIAGLGRQIDRVERNLSERIEQSESSFATQLGTLRDAETGTTWPRRIFWMLVGAGVGIGVEYLMDPDRGKSRRTQLSDQAAARAREVSDELQQKAKVATDRAKGQAIEAAKDALPEDVPSDPKLLEQRIKSEVFGHRDDVQDVVLRIDAPGTVAIKGTVPTPESQRELLAQVAEVEGVIDVRSELAVRTS